MKNPTSSLVTAFRYLSLAAASYVSQKATVLAPCPPLLHVPIQPLAMDYIIKIIISVEELENLNFSSKFDR